MKLSKLFDSLSIQVEKFRPLIELIIFIAGFLGIKNKNMITTIGLYILGFIIVVSIFTYLRQSNKKNNDLSFVRTFFHSEEWKNILSAVNKSLISLTGHKDKSKIQKLELIKNAVLSILEHKKDFTYNYAEQLVLYLIEDEKLNGFK